jgi:hypothetical protein
MAKELESLKGELSVLEKLVSDMNADIAFAKINAQAVLDSLGADREQLPDEVPDDEADITRDLDALADEHYTNDSASVLGTVSSDLVALAFQLATVAIQEPTKIFRIGDRVYSLIRHARRMYWALDNRGKPTGTDTRAMNRIERLQSDLDKNLKPHINELDKTLSRVTNGKISEQVYHDIQISRISADKPMTPNAVLKDPGKINISTGNPGSEEGETTLEEILEQIRVQGKSGNARAPEQKPDGPKASKSVDSAMAPEREPNSPPKSQPLKVPGTSNQNRNGPSTSTDSSKQLDVSSQNVNGQANPLNLPEVPKHDPNLPLSSQSLKDKISNLPDVPTHDPSLLKKMRYWHR